MRPDLRFTPVAIPGAVAALAIGHLVTILAVWSAGTADEASLGRQHRVAER